MAKDKDLTSLSDEDLMSEWTKAGKEAQALQERLRAFSKEHQRRVRKAQLEAVAAGLSEDDMALLQEARAEGIESQETVGSDN